jgi:hypothetical protein
LSGKDAGDAEKTGADNRQTSIARIPITANNLRFIVLSFDD